MNKPKASGLYEANGSIVIKDYLPHDLVAMAISLEFKAHVKGDSERETTICMGYQIVMPEFEMKSGRVEDQIIRVKLRMGPENNLED